MNTIKDLNKIVLLVILDGFGINPNDHKNAIMHAHKPSIDFLMNNFPMTTIQPGG